MWKRNFARVQRRISCPLYLPHMVLCLIVTAPKDGSWQYVCYFPLPGTKYHTPTTEGGEVYFGSKGCSPQSTGSREAACWSSTAKESWVNQGSWGKKREKKQPRGQADSSRHSRCDSAPLRGPLPQQVCPLMNVVSPWSSHLLKVPLWTHKALGETF